MENNGLYHVKGRDSMRTVDVIFVSDELVGSTIVSRKEYERLMRHKLKTDAEKGHNQKVPEGGDGSEGKHPKRKGGKNDLDDESKRGKYVDDVELALAALENDSVERVDVRQPSTLFDEGDVAAKDIYNLGNSVSCPVVVPSEKSANSAVTTVNSGTAKSGKVQKKVGSDEPPQTPFTLRRKVIRDIKEIQKILENSDGDFSGSESESSFRASDDSEAGSEDRDDSRESSPVGRSRTKSKPKSFFESYCDLESTKKKAKYSSNALRKLKTSKLTHEKLDEIVRSVEISSAHRKCIKSLFSDVLALFDKWDFILRQNFNLLLYGAGSKREILGKFVERYLDVSPVIVVNGFFPDVTGKEILEKVCDILKIKMDAMDVVDRIEAKIQNYNLDIYLAINNIDGIMLRNKKVQSMLSQLGRIDQIHIIASIDHINAPLIWDKRTSSEFNWVWFDSTTFLGYSEETLYEGNLMLQNSGKATLASLRNVFNALTKNSRGIFLIMVRNQVEASSGGAKGASAGISFRELYEECRRELLISTDVALRAQLKEFIDHMILKQKKNADGEEQFIIVMENSILKQFLDEQDGQQS